MKKTTNKNVRGLFFDMFGTLLVYSNIYKGWKNWAETFYGYVSAQKPGLKRKTFDSHCSGFFSKKMRINPSDGFTVYERRIMNAAKNMKVHISGQLLTKIVKDTITAFQKHIRIDDDAVAVLSALKEKYTLALITNYDHPPHMRQLIDDLNLSDIFTSIIISGEVGFMKPHPRIFKIALEQTDLHPGETVHIGDSRADIDGARASGIFPVLIKRQKENIPHDYTPAQKHYQGIHRNKNLYVIKTLKQLLGIYL